METLFLFFIFSVGLVDAQRQRQPVRGGVAAAKHEYPATVMVQFRFRDVEPKPSNSDNIIPDILGNPWTTYCVGALINSCTVLTSAECFENSTYYDLRVLANPQPNYYFGLDDDEDKHPLFTRVNFTGVAASVASTIKHPRYSKLIKSHDFMILKLATDIPIIGRKVQYARLPTTPSTPDLLPHIPSSIRCWLVSWGKEIGFSNFLLKAQVTMLPRFTGMGSLMGVQALNPSDRPCADDIGAPIYCWVNSGWRPILFGIMSGMNEWERDCVNSEEHFFAGNVASVLTWIRENS